MNGFGGGFEGSYAGDAGRIGAGAVLECKICWHVYDPATGDPTRQIPSGTAFRDLPGDWSCPGCGAPAAQFMVRSDPEAADPAVTEAAARLTAAFTEIWHAKMRDVPIVNRALHVEAIGLRRLGPSEPQAGRILGVLIAPWFMNLVLLPAAFDDWRALRAGEKEPIDFPSGTYEFLHNTREGLGGYKACSLFSPMEAFGSQMQAVEVARAVMAALFDPAVREGTDRAADIRAARQAALAPPPPPPASGSPSRRAVLSGGLAG